MTTETRTEVKEKPIIFSSPMVKAILEGRKTQTRQVIKPQPGMLWNGEPLADGGGYCKAPCGFKSMWEAIHSHLWVRETFCENEVSDEPEVFYQADGYMQFPSLRKLKWRPAIFMPRSASRITLEITGVRVERVQSISEEDAIAEGIYTNAEAIEKLGLPPETKLSGSCVDKYRIVWESINGKKFPWASNPWVWVIEFRRV